MFQIGIVIFERVEELDFVGPWEVLNLAVRLGAEASVCLVSERGGAVRCNDGLSVNVNYDFANCPPLDLILIPGGMGTRAEVDNPVLIDFVRQQAARSSWVTSVCTGAFILERAGLLGGRRVTTHWASLDRLRALGTADVTEERFVVDGNLVTSAGISAGIDMALWLVGQLWGKPLALQTQKQMEYYPRPPFTEEEMAAVVPPAYALRSAAVP